MASDPSWDDLFGPATPPSRAAEPVAATPAPASDPAPSPRALREAEKGARPARTPARRPGRGSRRPDGKRRRPWGWIIAMVVVIAIVAGAGVTAWVVFEDRIREVLGIAPPIDYDGSGNGEEVTIVIEPGDIGSDVATTLHEAGVTLTFRAFYELLLESPDVTFEPGNYLLQKQMSAVAALAALQDPASKIIDQVTIPEGVTAASALQLIASGTGIPIEELEAEAQNFTQFGIPASAPSIEGYLFPATYTFDPGTTAHQVIERLVNEMFARLDEAGVAPENRFRVLTMASIVQRESGPVAEDMPKIARVFENRLDRGMRLESDATVHYGVGDHSSVWTNPEDRQDASNPYNTYANDGLPIGPIGLPGAEAIAAAVQPADGTWLYFVTVDLRTGETVFSNTLAEHERAAQQLYAWCRADPENAPYCE